MNDDKNEILLSDVETLRQVAVSSVLALRRENTPRIGDPRWTSYTGYNYGRWADRGSKMALGLLKGTTPRVGETGVDFLHRVIKLVRAQRDEYRIDAADEDGACSGALDAAMWAIIGVLPKGPPDND